MAEKYSLSKVTLVIKNDTFGQITISGGSNKDNIVLRRSNPSFTKEDSADGPSVFTHNASKAGEVEITIKQTSRNIKDLTDFFNFCQANPELATSSMEVKDVFNVVNATAEEVFPSEMAENTLGQTPGNRTFPFISGKIDFQEG